MMEWKFVLHFILAFLIAIFLANLNHATPVPTSHDDDNGSNGAKLEPEENSRILCETACSKPGWQAKFDKEKSTCVCTVGNDDIDEMEKHALINQAKKNCLTLIFSKDKAQLKRDTTTKLEDNPKSIPAKAKESPSKLKNKKTESSKYNKSERTTTKSVPIDTPKDGQIKFVKDNAKEPIPKIASKSIQPEDLTPAKSNFKREPKEHEHETEESPTKHSKLIEHLKEMKSKTSEGMVGKEEPKHNLPKSVLPPKKVINFGCTATSARNQLETAKDRIVKLVEKTHRANFNCPQITAEIENIKGILQQAIQKNAEVKHREFDRTKIMEQIREKEKERQARIQARFGQLEMVRPKHRHNFGGSKNTEKVERAPTIIDKSDSHEVIEEPKNLIDT